MAKSITTAINYSCRIGVLVFAIIAYFYLPGLQEFLSAGITYLRCRDFEGLRLFILSYGSWAPAVSIVLMIIQSLIPIVPGLVITITNAWIFGWQYGALYSWVGALVGATLDFSVARWYGRLVIERLINSRYLDAIDIFLKKHGLIAVFITRLTPIVPFKIVSYGAGLTTMSLWRFMIATAIGQAPATILYSILGQNITHNIRITIAITSLLIMLLAVIYYYRDQIIGHFFPGDDL
ncbi:MAG: TVP38/TMEM64 family protein [Sporomusaceae bacterium]|nr:TVP38/TMEM64 family protein [Sporomusaceae bacterium]